MMEVVNYPIEFSLEDIIAQELPMTLALNESEGKTNQDLLDLFRFPQSQQSEMPFYVLRTDNAASIAEICEQTYDAMCWAIEWLAENREAVPHYYGADFCKKYPAFIDYAFWTYANNHEALYGRFDLALDPHTEQVTGIYEFNGDTPVMLFESTGLQHAFTQQVNAQTGHAYDEWNAYFPEAVEALDKVCRLSRTGQQSIGVALHADFVEDMATSETMFHLFDSHDKLYPMIDHINALDFDELWETSPFLLNEQEVSHLFVLQPWEEMVESAYDDIISRWQHWGEKVRFFEPAWRWLMSNKGIWALISDLLDTESEFREQYGHLPFLKSSLSSETFQQSGMDYVSKPLMGRLSNNITIIQQGETTYASDGMYKDEPLLFQEYCAPGQVEGRHNFIAGMWMAPIGQERAPLVMQAASLCIREFDQPVLNISNERFIPHLLRHE